MLLDQNKDDGVVKKITSSTIIQRFLEIAVHYPQKTAVRFHKHGKWQTITYAQLLQEAKTYASHLASLGVQRGDAVIVPSVRNRLLNSKYTEE